MTKLVIENLGFPSKLAGKPVGLLGGAAGRIGAVKSLEMLRGVCAHTGAIVLPGAISIAGVQRAFDGDRCSDEGSEKAIRGLAQSLLSFLADYVCPKLILEADTRGGDGVPWATSV
jgi:NAD(P)H-dependent FMN reductase